MPRNGSGVYSLPAGNPVVPGTTIDTSWANSTMEDLGNELTNSLSRTGAGGMLGPLRLTDGTITAPSLAFTSETNTGLYRSGAASAWMAVLGANIAQFSSTGVVIASGKALTVQGNATVGGTFGVTGAATLSSTLSVTGAITATGGVLGNVTAASGTSTFNNVTINGDLDMNAGSSGTITNLPNPTNSGDAANKAYVDAQDALRLALTGGTMTGAIAMSNQKITGVGTPSADGDAANKAYVDSVAQGLDIKASVRAATTGNITLSGTQTIDGVSIGVGDRVLVKDQSTAAQNGIYVAASSSWSRSSDADTWAELVGAFVFVEDGTTNDNSGWVCTVAPGGTLGSTAVTWEQFSGAGQINAGTGMTKTGNTLNVNTASSSRIVVGADEIDLATTGVTASTYKSVTVDAYGRVTAGTNPTTLSGYGITDAYTQTQVDNLLAAKLSLSGGTMTGAIAMGTYKITGLGDPTLAQDAATKNYIDTIFGSTTSAAASAAAAASSASAASTSASNASTSASNASTSATNAASSASSALSYLNTFRGQYLGASATDPTVDGNGNALTAGDLYFNTTSSEMRVYTGSAWAAAYLPASGYAQLASTNTFTAPQIISVNSASDGLKITQAGSGPALYIQTGNVGIGVTPESMLSVVRAVRVGQGAMLEGRSNSTVLNLSANQYISAAGQRTYITTGEAAYYEQIVGQHRWFTAPSGTAGNPITFTQAMTLDASGNLGIGTSSPSYLLHAAGTNPRINVSASSTGYAGYRASNTSGTFQVAIDDSTGSNYLGTAYGRVIYSDGAYPLQFATNATERMRIDSSGNVGIGVTPSYKLHVNGVTYADNFRVPNTAGFFYDIAGQNGLYIYGTTHGSIPNTLSLNTNGTERMRINSSGVVSVGTTSSGSGKLNVYAGNDTAQPSAALYILRSYGVHPGITSNFYGIYCEATTSGNASPTTSAGIASVCGSSTGPAFLARTDSGGNSGYAYYAYFNNSDSNGYGSANLFRGEIVQTGPNPGNSSYYGTHITFPNYTHNGNAIYAHYWNTQYTGSGTQYFAYIVRNGSNIGSISTTASATAYNTSSDYRLKENVQPMTNALAAVAQLNPVTYTWKSTGEAGQGFIAHELQAVVPDAVTGEKDAIKTERVEVSPAVPATYDEEGNELTPAVEAVFEDREVPVYQGVDTSFLVATLTAAIQELKAIVDAQAARIATLEGN